MKIAFIYDGAYPWNVGGVEKRLYEIGKRLANKGHEVHHFTLNWWDGEKELVKDGIHYHGIGRQLKFYKGDRRSIKEALYFGLKTFTGLDDDFDLFDCQQFPYFPCFSSWIHSQFKKMPLVITWHEIWGDYWYKYLGKKGFLGKMVETLTTRLTKHNIAVSEKTRQDLLNMGIDNIELIPNGVDLKKIKKIKPSSLESDVIFAGRLLKHKNIDILIKAISILKKEYPDIKCIIIGEGPEKENLKRITRQLNLEDNIHFLPFLGYDELIAHMKSSKVFVLPSTREGFGMVAIEANATGLPVITVDHPQNAAKDFIEDDKYICKLSSIEIAQKISELLNSNKIHTFYKNYDWNNITKKIEKYYREINFK
ncbi:MAG: glycosyltransferase family 4 protein [Methanobacteriales archaeon]